MAECYLAKVKFWSWWKLLVSQVGFLNTNNNLLENKMLKKPKQLIQRACLTTKYLVTNLIRNVYDVYETNYILFKKGIEEYLN